VAKNFPQFLCRYRLHDVSEAAPLFWGGFCCMFCQDVPEPFPIFDLRAGELSRWCSWVAEG
jgi:hypothetical protein